MLDLEGWKVLREGGSKNKGKGSHSVAYRAAHEATWLEGNSEGQEATAAWAPTGAGGGLTGTRDSLRPQTWAGPLPPAGVLARAEASHQPTCLQLLFPFLCLAQPSHPFLLNEFLPLCLAAHEASIKAEP